jgi:parallel beta-helix repeat protein
MTYIPKVCKAKLLILTGICGLACAMVAATCTAAELYVRAGDDAGAGDQKSPFNSINAAVAAAQEGDTILIAQGTYPEQIVLHKNHITLKGGYDSAFERGRNPLKYETIIDGQNKFRPLQIGGDGTAISKFHINGLTIMRGLAEGAESLEGKGGAILIAGDSSGKIVRCKFVDNWATDDGGAIEYSSSGTLKIDRCLFSGNSAHDDGGAIRLQGSRSTTTISNCVFVNNSGLDKYVVQAKGDTRILNCTFADNSSNARGIIASRSKAATTDATVTVTNCIFASNKSLDNDPLLFADDDCAPIVAAGCLFFDNQAAGGLGEDVQISSNGHREGDPQFADAAAGDFRLSEGSPAIDNALAIESVKKDFDGNRRPQGTAVDIGAFESLSTRSN